MAWYLVMYRDNKFFK